MSKGRSTDLSTIIQESMPNGMRSASLVGRVFGNLTVIEYVGYRKTGTGTVSFWRCRCGGDCGKYTIVRRTNLTSGNTSSCGCVRDNCRGQAQRTHGMSETALYVVWRTLVDRCINPNNTGYYKYGGRGITVCDKWRTFEGFYEDMGDRPSSKHSVDRTNNDGPYCKDNCRWATAREQSRNTRATYLVTHNDETRPLVDWVEGTGLPYTTVWSRIRGGWSVERALTTPVKGK